MVITRFVIERQERRKEGRRGKDGTPPQRGERRGPSITQVLIIVVVGGGRDGCRCSELPPLLPCRRVSKLPLYFNPQQVRETFNSGKAGLAVYWSPAAARRLRVADVEGKARAVTSHPNMWDRLLKNGEESCVPAGASPLPSLVAKPEEAAASMPQASKHDIVIREVRASIDLNFASYSR